MQNKYSYFISVHHFHMLKLYLKHDLNWTEQSFPLFIKKPICPSTSTLLLSTNASIASCVLPTHLENIVECQVIHTGCPVSICIRRGAVVFFNNLSIQALLLLQSFMNHQRKLLNWEKYISSVNESIFQIINFYRWKLNFDINHTRYGNDRDINIKENM